MSRSSQHNLELAAADFASYFTFVHDDPPYPWQTRLAAQVLDTGEFPRVIDLPTGSGKTSVVDVALFALAVDSSVFPRRVVFVIDRRIVVDSVVESAQRISIRLASVTADDPVPYEVRRRLLALWGEDEDSKEPPIEVAALRGGIPNEHGWARLPDRPAIIASTVDQFGSRLLMRGYSTSPGMKPIHAGLAGNDCLVILDEVHISSAFATTLQEVTSCGKFPGINAATDLLPRRFKVVEMSATPVAGRDTPRFTLDADDTRLSPTLAAIVAPHKRIECAAGKGLGLLKKNKEHDEMPKKVKHLLDANRLNATERNGTVGVIVNRVRTARSVHQALIADGYESHLMTGRMRPLDRADVVARINDVADPDRDAPTEERPDGKPRVVVATQCIEVGADFSFDLLITECAPVDSLKQRLGRLDRRGAVGTAEQPTRCVVVGHESKEDYVYGTALKNTWDVLKVQTADGPRDAAPDSDLWSAFSYDEDDADCCLARSPEPPVLLPTHVEAWAQTSPQPDAQSAPDWFLHGLHTDRPRDVEIVWRWDASCEGLAEMPIRAAEQLAVPCGAARRWLAVLGEGDMADVPHADADDDPKQDIQVMRYRRQKGRPPLELLSNTSDIKPGDTLIVSPTVGGVTDGNWCPQPDDEVKPVEDLGARAQFESSYCTVVALHPALDYSPTPPQPNARGEITDEDREDIEAWLRAVTSPSDEDSTALRDMCEYLLACGYRASVVSGDENQHPYFVLRASGATTEISDDDEPSMTGRGTLLRDHLAGVGERAAAMAERLGMPANIVDDLRLAAEIHDIGKTDPRFQRMLRGAQALNVEITDSEPLAKSMLGVRGRKGPPVRHELASVLLAESNSELLKSAHESDLVLHLVASHHGYARPLPLAHVDDDPQTLSYDARTSAGSFVTKTCTADADDAFRFAVAERFWAVYERYGHHGMCWLESILRLADHRQSEEEGRK